MKKTTIRIVRTTAALAAALAAAAPLTAQPAAQICTIVASAASASDVSAMEADIRQNPQDYFTVSSETNEDGYYTITSFHRPTRFQNVKLKTLTVPAQIGNKRITRIKGEGGKFPDPAISDPDLTSIVFSYGFRVLDSDAIRFCPNLETVTLPSSVNAFGYYCVRDCEKLRKFNVSTNILNIPYDFIQSCPNMNEAWSERAAYIMIKNGVDILTINGSPIITDLGSSKKPVMSSALEAALKSSYDLLENTKLLDTYLRIYSRYLLKNVMGVTSSMSFNQKVKRIYDYVIPRVTYDKDAFDMVTESDGYTHIQSNGSNKAGSSGAIFFSDKAICEGFTKGLNYLFREAGITSYRVSELDTVHLANGKTDTAGHAFNVIYYNNMYFIVDATCRENAFMMNLNEERKFHDVEDISGWEITTISGQLVNLNSTLQNQLRYALGDVNCDGYVNSADMSVLLAYNNAGSSEKYTIADSYGLTVSQFECLADADCSGSLSYFADGSAITALKNRFNF